MKKKIKEVKLSKDYQTNECFIPKGTSAIINFTGDMFLFKNRSYVKQFTLKEIKPIGELNDVSIFDIEYEEEQKELIVSIKFKDHKDVRINPNDVFICLTTNTHHNDDFWQIKVTEIKPLAKEDAEWFFKKRYYHTNFEIIWAEFQAKKEAENEIKK